MWSSSADEPMDSREVSTDEKNKRNNSTTTSVTSNTSELAVGVMALLKQDMKKAHTQVKQMIKSNKEHARLVLTTEVRGWTPVHASALRGSKKLLKVMLRSGIDVNCVMGRPEGLPAGCSLLHIAANRRDKKVLHYLLQHGADIHAQDSNHCTALDYAKRVGNKEAVRLLLDRGATNTPTCVTVAAASSMPPTCAVIAASKPTANYVNNNYYEFNSKNDEIACYVDGDDGHGDGRVDNEDISHRAGCDNSKVTIKITPAERDSKNRNHIVGGAASNKSKTLCDGKVGIVGDGNNSSVDVNSRSSISNNTINSSSSSSSSKRSSSEEVAASVKPKRPQNLNLSYRTTQHDNSCRRQGNSSEPHERLQVPSPHKCKLLPKKMTHKVSKTQREHANCVPTSVLVDDTSDANPQHSPRLSHTGNQQSHQLHHHYQQHQQQQPNQQQSPPQQHHPHQIEQQQQKHHVQRQHYQQQQQQQQQQKQQLTPTQKSFNGFPPYYRKLSCVGEETEADKEQQQHLPHAQLQQHHQQQQQQQQQQQKTSTSNCKKQPDQIETSKTTRSKTETDDKQQPHSNSEIITKAASQQHHFHHPHYHNHFNRRVSLVRNELLKQQQQQQQAQQKQQQQQQQNMQ